MPLSSHFPKHHWCHQSLQSFIFHVVCNSSILLVCLIYFATAISCWRFCITLFFAVFLLHYLSKSLAISPFDPTLLASISIWLSILKCEIELTRTALPKSSYSKSLPSFFFFFYLSFVDSIAWQQFCAPKSNRFFLHMYFLQLLLRF